MNTYLYDSKDECVSSGQHSSSVDEDGFCNFCGHEPTEENEDE